MPGNLRLRPPKNLNEIANTYLLVAHEVEEPEPCIVSKGLKEALHIERWCSRCHSLLIRIDECVCNRYSRQSKYV